MSDSNKVVKFPVKKVGYSNFEEFIEMFSGSDWESVAIVGMTKDQAIVIEGFNCRNDSLCWFGEHMKMEAMGLQQLIDDVYDPS